MKRTIIIGLTIIALFLVMSNPAVSKQGMRIEDLVIEKFVDRSIGKTLELIAFAPGSGWLKLITPDGMTPMISFDGVSLDDINKFNRYAETIGYPFRVKLVKKTLHIQHIRNRLISADTRIDYRATRKRNFFRLAALPTNTIKRGKTNKVLLGAVNAQNGKADTTLRNNRVTKLRNAGFKLVQKSFASLEESPELNEVIELKNVKIRIVGKREQFDKEAQHYGDGVLGYATADYEITILGKRVGDKIVINQAVLGHELNHLLNYKRAEIANPDDLEEMGL